MLYTRCILGTPDSVDGYRISVMNRHTLNDGVTPDTRITQDSFDQWLVELSPPSKLVGDYYKRGLPWEEYESRYLEAIRMPEKQIMVGRLSVRAFQDDITLLCIEETADRCHRRLLAEECVRLNPRLSVIHR